jgi:hypothetical protein
MAKEIQLTQGQVAIVDDDDFERLNQWKWQAHRDPKSKHYYAVHSFHKENGCKGKVRMHRLIMEAPKGRLVDHIESEQTLNNQRSNLRFASRSQNTCNSKIRVNNKSGFRGVHWHKSAGKYASQININGQIKTLGFFLEKADAARVRDRAVIEHFGEFARLNFPREDYGNA